MISILQGRTAAPTPIDPNNLTRALHLEDLPAKLIEVAIIIVISVLIYHVSKLIVRRIVSHHIDEDDPIVRRLREQRLQTLGGLFTNILLVVVIIVSALTILDRFINIAPLLASVSVVGLAFSFGAQSLVKDMISGTFMLIEGQFGIGDVVRVGDTSGLVEKITLRTTILRDVQGTVHIIPNGEITRVSNLTKTWSRAVIDVGVAYREDVDRVIATLRNLGAEFHSNPEWAPLLLDPPEVLGIEALGDSAVTVRMTAKTLPLKQWDVARELRRLIKKRFDQEGIEIPFPHLTFYWGDGQMPELKERSH